MTVIAVLAGMKQGVLDLIIKSHCDTYIHIHNNAVKDVKYQMLRT